MELLLIHLAKSAGLLIVFFALYYFLLRKDHSFSANRKFLLGGLLASAILPSVHFTRKVIIEAQATSFPIMEGNFPVSEVITQEPMITPLQILLAIYLAGVVFMTGRMLLQLLSLFKVLYSGEVNKKEGINYISVNGKMAPFSFLNFIVYNPDLHSETEMLHILEHEKVHVTYWHTADVLVANLNLIYQWFNPFAWLYVKILQQNLEYIADSEAVKGAPCKKEYQKALLKISVENFNPGLTNSFYQSFIKKRIIMLNEKITSKNNYWKICLALPLMLAFIFLFNIKTEAQVKITENTVESTPKDTITTLKVSVIITKESSEERLALIKEMMAKQDVILEFENIERSPEGLITSINVSMLHKKNNNSLNVYKNRKEGIVDFEIFVKDGEAGFADVSTQKKTSNTPQEVFKQLGMNPLYIINGVEYTSRDLEGKTIETTDGFAMLNPENATQHGEKGKDGVIMISKGKIIDNFSEEMRSIDLEKIKVKRSYIQIREGEKPVFIEVDNTAVGKSKSLNGTTPTKTGSASNSGAQELNDIKGNPVFILNGVKVDKSKVKSINPSEIEQVTVLKGKNATSIYGKAAKDGAILIRTKSNKMVVLKSVSFSTDEKEDNLNLYDEMLARSQKPMVIIDGKIQNDSFNLGDVDPNDIQNMDITTGEEVIKRYGEQAKDGVLNITSKAAGGMKTVNSSVIRTGNSKFSKKGIGYTINSDSVNINASQWTNNSSPPNTEFYIGRKNPLYVVDGQEMPFNFKSSSLDPADIAGISVLKDKVSIKKYGEKGKDGVIEITTKKGEKKANSFFAVLKASTTNEEMRILKEQIEKQSGLDVKFSDIKRNREGLITAIKVTGKKGNQEVSATYNETGKIPDIYIGVQQETIIVTSTPPWS